MVMVPRPGVCRRVKLATALPEMPGWSADTRGAHANSPTGCRTGRAGRIRMRALMSASVAPPSRPSGLSSANGHRHAAPAAFRRLPHSAACSDDDDSAREQRSSRSEKKNGRRSVSTSLRERNDWTPTLAPAALWGCCWQREFACRMRARAGA